MHEFKLGDKLKDLVSGMEGIAVSRIEYLNGCIQYGIALNTGKNKIPEDCRYFDENQLKRVGAGLNIKKKDTGGPSPYQPKN